MCISLTIFLFSIQWKASINYVFALKTQIKEQPMKNPINKVLTPLFFYLWWLGVGVTLRNQKEIVKSEAAVHSVTINRNSFPSGALAFRVDDKWTATGTDGVVYEGYFDIYATAGQTTLKSKPMSPFINHFHNTTPFQVALRRLKRFMVAVRPAN